MPLMETDANAISGFDMVYQMAHTDLGSAIDAMDHGVTTFSHVLADASTALQSSAASEVSLSTGGSGEGSLGHDIFIFLVASVFVVPICKSLNITPVLGFLIVGCVLGPYGLGLFSNSEQDIELGDFGILFLLFNEGLSLSPERIKELGRFTGLGAFQLIISIGFIFLGSVLGGPVLVKYAQEIGYPLASNLLRPLFDNPIESFCIASAGALSSSAFVLPFLKEKDWEERPEGIAGLSILLLQDLAVAPLLVVLPLLAGSGPQSAVELAILVSKATIGFGAVLIAGSYGLRFVFDLVASARSTETFVAASLLVAVGMGQVADFLGLSASTGAFAAGVLLAGNRYRAQIQADIKPFEGILLGIFFITAGANLDPVLVLQEWPTLVAGIIVFILTKAGIIFASGPSLGLTTAESARVALVLAGGGEFAFVVFQLAQDLGILPSKVANLLIASVIISMSLTPILGEIGVLAANFIESEGETIRADGLTTKQEIELFDKIDTDQSGTIDIEELREALVRLDFSYTAIAEVFAIFDTDGDGLISREEWKVGTESGVLSEACSRDISDSSLSSNELSFSDDAIIICGFGEVGQEIYQMLDGFGLVGTGTSNVICFDLNPKRVLAGTLNGAPVVFGDGARIELLKAAGVKSPRAAIVTYASDDRRISATMRLRSCLPEGTPIYVYEGNSRIGPKLLETGATEIIVEKTETSLRFASLLGAYTTNDEASQLRELSMNRFAMKATDSDHDSESIKMPGISEEFLIDLCDELGCSRKNIEELHDSFQAVAGEKDSVPISDLKDYVMRQSSDGPLNESQITTCMSLEDEDGEGDVTFIEYLRANFNAECSLDVPP
jgi:Kef-type K+ transport system membrane component KefB/voltage-gated potassium channel Kch